MCQVDLRADLVGPKLVKGHDKDVEGEDKDQEEEGPIHAEHHQAQHAVLTLVQDWDDRAIRVAPVGTMAKNTAVIFVSV